MMTDTRLLLALPVLALLAACGGKSSGNDSRAASGDVLEGTISDSMLPTDRVRSEPPLEDPEAFAEARTKAAGAGGAGEATEGAEPAAEGTETATPTATPATAPE